MSDGIEPLWQRHMRRCVHFNGMGMGHACCEAGVPYESVRDTSMRPHRYPCIDPHRAVHCEKAEYPTEGEARAWEGRIRERSIQMNQLLAEGKCSHCGKPMTKRQVGRCVYAEPCGHRLYQGRA